MMYCGLNIAGQWPVNAKKKQTHHPSKVDRCCFCSCFAASPQVIAHLWGTVSRIGEIMMSGSEQHMYSLLGYRGGPPAERIYHKWA
eukprot:15337278-Ditylum_brightwellii.AAC.1